jgi:polar amino acid transport system substrate-binding protein
MKTKPRNHDVRSFARIVTGMIVSVVLMGANVIATDQSLTMAVSLDIPPYVMTNATSGVELDLMRRALPDFEMKWRQMDYQALESAISDKKVDAAMSVREHRPGVFYSLDYIGFVNFAISKKADHLHIASVVDLKGHPVLTWQDAWRELGDAFKTQYAPDSAERTNYVEVADQAKQVREFWEGTGKVIVIDRSIFDYLSEQMGHALDEVQYHPLFPKVTAFKVGFAEAAVRDKFNAGLKRLCQSGEYHQLLKRYHMPDVAGVCDEFKKSKSMRMKQ